MGYVKVRDILARIDAIAPFRLAEEWDNVGLMVGDTEWDIHHLGLTLDPLPDAMEEAFRKGCQGILTHHPLFFKPTHSIDLSSTLGRTIQMAIKGEMVVLTAHTNWDNAESGVSRVLAKKLRLNTITPLVQAKLVQAKEEVGGAGAVGDLAAETSIREVLDRVKRAWNLTWLDYYGPVDGNVTRIALCGGSGGNLWPKALAMKADLYVTADMKYHDIIDCLRAGLPVAIVDHGEMESVTLVELAWYLSVPGDLELMLLDCRALDTPLRL
ncbi:MAG: Nif3-like dinuclear metal center hexameric protein [Synergistaceae bacterium]|nr:Nif3-like dinuclear metal center hexameric protein [Synergistaceae bacterium]